MLWKCGGLWEGGSNTCGNVHGQKVEECGRGERAENALLLLPWRAGVQFSTPWIWAGLSDLSVNRMKPYSFYLGLLIYRGAIKEVWPLCWRDPEERPWDHLWNVTQQSARRHQTSLSFYAWSEPAALGPPEQPLAKYHRVTCQRHKENCSAETYTKSLPTKSWDVIEWLLIWATMFWSASLCRNGQLEQCLQMHTIILMHCLIHSFIHLKNTEDHYVSGTMLYTRDITGKKNSEDMKLTGIDRQ